MKGKMISLRLITRFTTFMLLVLFFLSHALVYAHQGRKNNQLKATSQLVKKVLIQDEGVPKEGLGGRKITQVNVINLKGTPRDETVSSKHGSREKGGSLKPKDNLVVINADYRCPKSNPSRHH